MECHNQMTQPTQTPKGTILNIVPYSASNIVDEQYNVFIRAVHWMSAAAEYKVEKFVLRKFQLDFHVMV